MVGAGCQPDQVGRASGAGVEGTSAEGRRASFWRSRPPQRLQNRAAGLTEAPHFGQNLAIDTLLSPSSGGMWADPWGSGQIRSAPPGGLLPDPPKLSQAVKVSGVCARMVFVLYLQAWGSPRDFPSVLCGAPEIGRRTLDERAHPTRPTQQSGRQRRDRCGHRGRRPDGRRGGRCRGILLLEDPDGGLRRFDDRNGGQDGPGQHPGVGGLRPGTRRSAPGSAEADP